MTNNDLPAMLPELLPRLWSFAMRLTSDRHDAEDLVQRACVRALERAHQWRPGTSAISWLFSIVQSIWFNEIRARNARKRNGMEWSDELVNTVADPAAINPETDALHQQVLKAVSLLPEPQRVVMLLVAVEGLSYNEAAEVLDIPVGTVMSRLSRARLSIGALFNAGKAQENESRERRAGVRSNEAG